jgi:large subunit ribosomal protein L29
MKIKEIRKLSQDELRTKVNALKKDLFNSRFKRVNGQLTDTAKLAQTKKDVARALTLLKVKK